MPRKEQSPIARIALSQFRYSFDDLLKPQAYLNSFSQYIIEIVVEIVMWFGRPKDDYKNFERTARVASYFLEGGTQKKPEAVASNFIVVLDKLIPALNISRMAESKAKQVSEDDPDTRIENYLAYYKVMYEGLLPFICSPIIFAFGVSRKSANRAFIPNAEGKIDLMAIGEMNKLLAYLDNRLAIGLNNHLRNAYSHNSYRILDDAQVKLWDRKWGPEIWHLEQIVSICDQLWINALGIIGGLILYDINNRRTMEDRGWISSIPTPPLRRKEINAAVDSLSNEFGFYMDSLELVPNHISLNLRTKSKGIEQDAKQIMGYKTHTVYLKIPLWYEERKVIDQLVKMLYRLIPYFEDQNEVSFYITSIDNTPLGTLTTDFGTLIGLNLSDTKSDTVESVRHIFKTDTLGDSTTFIEFEGAPRLDRIGPAMSSDEFKNSISKKVR